MKYNSSYNLLTKCADTILKPIYCNWPFIILITILGAIVPVVSFFEDPLPIIGYIGRKCALSSIMRSFAATYLIAWLLQISVLQRLKWPYFIMVTLISVLLLAAHMIFSLELSPALYSIISCTTNQEIKEFFHTLPWYYYICYFMAAGVTIYIFAFLDKNKNIIYLKFLHAPFVRVIFAFFITISLLCGVMKFHEIKTAWQTKDYYTFFDWQFSRGFSWYMPRDIYSASGLLIRELSFKSGVWELQMAKDQHTPAFDTINSTDSINIVLVIGESYQRWHASLYGYPLQTTPVMDKERAQGNLIAIHDAASVCCYTTDAVYNILSLNRSSDNEDHNHYPFFPQLFHNAKWDTFFCEHQYTPNNIFDNHLYSTIKNPVLIKNCWTSYIESHDIPYDHLSLRKDWEQIDCSISKSAHRFIIHHLKGQHFDYKKRYPDSLQYAPFSHNNYAWRKEPWLDSRRRQTIAEYDNATYYNDYTMGNLFDHYRNSVTVIVYVSDHGEEVYDYRDFSGREWHPDKDIDKWIDHILRVPLIIWMSDKFMAQYPEKTNAIKSAETQIMSIDDIGHFMLWLAGIHTEPYNAEHNFISPMYITPSRKTLDNMNISPL